MTVELKVNEKYDVDSLEFTGWSDGKSHDTYCYQDWFEDDGTYRGADCDGLEPVANSRKMTLILINSQGASEEYRNVAGKEAAREIIATWQDPENLTARLIDEGEYLYEGPAVAL